MFAALTVGPLRAACCFSPSGNRFFLLQLVQPGCNSWVLIIKYIEAVVDCAEPFRLCPSEAWLPVVVDEIQTDRGEYDSVYSVVVHAMHEIVATCEAIEEHAVGKRVSSDDAVHEGIVACD